MSSTINVRSTASGVGGRATCPCGWVHTSTKKGAALAASCHNDNNHGGDHEVAIDYRQED